jgi:hypothetical protein
VIKYVLSKESDPLGLQKYRRGLEAENALGSGILGLRDAMKNDKKGKVIETLNKILEMELAGAIHYTHYSFMVFGITGYPSLNGSKIRPQNRLLMPGRRAN